jgi:hypothetical protein
MNEKDYVTENGNFNILKLSKLYTKIYFVTKNSVSITKTRYLMLSMEIIAIINSKYTERMNALCKQNTEFLGKMLSFCFKLLQ